MDKIEEKVLKSYRDNISRIIRRKYRKKALLEARSKKMYFPVGENNRDIIKNLTNDIYATYTVIIESEIEVLVSEFKNSEKFQKAINAEKELSKKKLNFKSLKKYQEFKINIDKKFLKLLYEEVNSDDQIKISIEEIQYIILLIFYKIIDYIKNGYKVKVGTIFNIWLDKRDMRINLPDVKNHLLENRIVPKLKLCKGFSYNLFNAINKDNEAIINYYKAKMERFLMLLKIKGGKTNANDKVDWFNWWNSK